MENFLFRTLVLKTQNKNHLFFFLISIPTKLIYLINNPRKFSYVKKFIVEYINTEGVKVLSILSSKYISLRPKVFETLISVNGYPLIYMVF